MIIKIPFECGDTIQYFGKDAEDFLESINWHSDIDYLGKECTTKHGIGIIIGFEDNNLYNDYYYIIYLPQIDKVIYELANNTEFIDSIKI